MNRQDVRSRFAYNQWANHRLVQAAERLAPESYAKDLNASFGSLRGTLIHLLWAECWWLQFWRDGTLMPDFPPEAFPDVPALAEKWTKLEQELEAFVSGLSDAQLDAPWSVRRVARGPAGMENPLCEYTLSELIHHLLNHSTYHRGQVALLLRQLGQRPPSTDFRLFLTELRLGVA